MRPIDAHQKRFLRIQLFSVTLMATVQRADVYKPGASDKKRQAFQSSLRRQLEWLAQEYSNGATEERHIQNILALSRDLSAQNRHVLLDGRLRIGTAQEALNLYLKYLWCAGAIDTPPRCPFEAQIVVRLPKYSGPSWTKLDSEEEYRALVKAAKEEARKQNLPLAAWELQTYNDT